MSAVRELEAVLPKLAGNSMLRYEAFTRLLALLGSMPDSDTIEIIQTGLGGVEWEQLAESDRERFAQHLRHLAEQVQPEPHQLEMRQSEPAVGPAPDFHHQQASPIKELLTIPGPEVKPEPAMPSTDTSYDCGRFGEQARLVAALKEQPEDMSLDQLLNALMRD